MDNKKILFDVDARAGLKKGIDIVANAVKVTLGYGGRTVVVSETGLPTRTTKDGVTVAKHIKLRDEVEDAGAKFIKDISSKTADDTGDGTTSVCVLMQAMVEEGMKHLSNSENPVLIKKGMEIAKDEIVKYLKSISTEPTFEQIKQVATVSANNDEEIGGVIGEAYDKLGKFGRIAVEDSKTPETKVEISKGFSFMCGWDSHHFINNHEENTCELKNPYILIVEGKIERWEDIEAIMNKVAKEERSVVLIAEGFDFNVAATMVRNRNILSQKGTPLLPSCLIRYNFTGDTKQEIMYDLLAMTGAKLPEKQGDILKNIKIESLGQCEKIIIGKDDTTIVRGTEVEELVKSRLKDAEVKLEKANHPWLKQKQEERMAKLGGKIAICYVGGKTEVEIEEKKARVDDSIRATRAALEEGIVVGGGSALIRCWKAIESLSHPNKTINAGIGIVRDAIQMPAKQIMINAIGDEKEVEERMGLLRNSVNANHGYNVISGSIEDLVESGIIDPHKVVRVCIENAVSGAAQVLMSQSLIVSDNK